MASGREGVGMDDQSLEARKKGEEHTTAKLQAGTDQTWGAAARVV